MKKIALIIESSTISELWGRVKFEDNLIIDSAKDLPSLQLKMKKLLKRFHQLGPTEIEFDLQYDITGLFDEKKYLNASAVANVAQISPGLMRQYTSGVKHPSAERVKQIEAAVRYIGHELSTIKLSAGG